MVNYTYYWRILLFVCLSYGSARAQDPPTGSRPRVPDFEEFNKRAVLPVEVGMGFSSKQSKALFSLQMSPQVTIPHNWRLGMSLGAAYTEVEPEKGEQWIGYAGPKISYKLSTLGLKINGIPRSINYANINVFGEHLWATNNVRLYGIGITGEFLKRFAVTLKVHRDYQHNSTWGQLGLSLNLIGQRPEESFQTNH